MSAIPSAAQPARAPDRHAPVGLTKPPKKRPLAVLMALLSIAAFAVIVYQLWLKPAGQPKVAPGAAIRTAKALAGPLEVTLRLSGQTSARNFANVRAPMTQGDRSGALTLLKVANSGSWVNKGDVVAEIDSQAAQDHIDDLKDTIQQAENDVGKRRAEQAVEWENTLQTLRVSKANFDKAQLDYSAAEVKTDIERELLKLARDEAEARYREQQKDLDFQKSSQTSEIRILELTLAQHKKHIGRHMHDIVQYTAHAPMPGLAVMASIWRGGDMGQVQQGDNIWPGQQILKIVDTRSMQVEANVSQADAGDLRIGQRVRVGLDAFPDLTFTGRVYSIGALAVGGWSTSYYIRSVPVRVAIEGTDPRLIPDLSAHADVILSSQPAQAQVPIGAVHEANGSAWVLVKAADSFERRAVTLGQRNNVMVAVESGLRAGDVVKLN